MHKWYVIRCKPHKEFTAQLNFARQGYEVYLPVIRKTVRHARKITEVYKPFFPGYLFLNISKSTQSWHPLFSTKGAIGPVSFGKEYVPVPDWVISDLRTNEEKPGVISTEKLLYRQLRSGDEVEVDLAGGAVGKGKIFSIDGERNVIVLLELLKRRVKTKVPLASIRLQAEAAA